VGNFFISMVVLNRLLPVLVKC